MAISEIHPTPFVEDLKKYSLAGFRGDLISAFSVALMALPQAMAYAILADLPPSAGIWSVVFGIFFTAAFGSSRFLVSGTTNMIAILLQSGTSEILYSYYRTIAGGERDILALNIMTELVLIVGVFQILAALLRLGRLTQFISRSVVIGYMAGAAIAIIITQLFSFVGIRDQLGYQPIYQQGWYFVTHLHVLHWATTFLSIGSLALLVILYRLSEKIPAAAIVFVLASSIVALLNLSPREAKGTFNTLPGEKIDRVALVQDFGSLLSDFPHFNPPFFEMRILDKIIPLAFALTLLSVLEATSIGRSYTKAKEPPYNDNQEIYGLGISNVVSSFFGAMPSSGSFTRSSLNQSTGAKTRFSAIFSSLFVLIFILSFGFLIAKIPIAAISALMVFTAYTMVNFRHLGICLRATRSDAFVVLATFGSTLVFSLDSALYVGVILSIVLYLKKAAVPLLIEYTFTNVGKLRPLEEEDERPDPRICIIQAEGELFFGAADPLQTKMRQISEDENLRVVILQLLNTRYLDASVCLALEKICGYLQATNRFLMLTGISPEVWSVLHETGLIQLIGEVNCFAANEQLPSEPTRDAYALAKELIIT